MKGLTSENYQYVTTIRNYMKLNQKLQEVDVIIVPGSSDDSYISKVVQLYQQGYVHHIICSGNGSNYVVQRFNETQASHHASLLEQQGVPLSAIVLEEQAMTTGENMCLSYQIMKSYNWDKCIIVQRPFLERRMYATACYESFDGRRPASISVSSSSDSIEQHDIVNTLHFNRIYALVGEVHRIRVCNEQGWIICQEIPDNVRNAYLILVEMGYGQLLMKGYPVW